MISIKIPVTCRLLSLSFSCCPLDLRVNYRVYIHAMNKRKVPLPSLPTVNVPILLSLHDNNAFSNLCCCLSLCHFSHDLRARGWKIAVRFPAGARDFSLLHSVQTGSRANQWVTGAASPEVKRQSGRDVKLTTYLHLVARSRIVVLCLHSLIRLHSALLN
jgi:hypothetical protein